MPVGTGSRLDAANITASTHGPFVLSPVPLALRLSRDQDGGLSKLTIDKNRRQ